MGDEEEFSKKSRGHYTENYTKDDLQEAIEKIRNNEMSFGAASKLYKVPKTTIYNKMKNPVSCPKGATTILSKEQEDELADWILLSADYGDPRTKQDIILAAGEIAQLDANPSNNFKNGMPSPSWIDGFFKRHPQCRLRKPQGMSKASAINTRDDFAGLWRNIYSYFERTNQLHVLDKPELWWNADETAFEKDKVPKKVVARRGAKRVSRREMGAPKDNTTVTYAFSAAGDYVEPLITLKNSSSTVAEVAFALGTVGANYGINQTESGWTRHDSFFYFVSMHLHNQWEAKQIPKPRVLTIDGYRAHFSLRLFRWSRQNGVIIIVLYPGATPYLQMCDTTMFSPMKTKHEQLYSQWRFKNPTKTMNDVEFVKLLKQINDAVIKKQTIINGWRATGLQPFNFNNLKTDSLLSKSPDRVYDFKGTCIDSPGTTIVVNDTVSQSKVNVVSNVVLDQSSEFYVHQNKLFNMVNTLHTSDRITDSTTFQHKNKINDNNNDLSDRPMEVDADCSVCDESILLVQNRKDIAVELVDVDLEECPEGLFPTESSYSYQPLVMDTVGVSPEQQIEECPEGLLPSESSYACQPSLINTAEVNSRDQPIEIEIDHSRQSLNDQVRPNDSSVKFSELAVHDGIFQSKLEANFNLSSFGLSTEPSDTQNAGKIQKLTEKIRRDVKQLGLLCAAIDKEKLINVLVINQQLNFIDPPQVEALEPPVIEPRTIKNILKPPTMPQRVKPKKNMNLKISYGVMTAKEIVQSVYEREAADRQQEIEREENEIAKHERENEIKELDEKLKDIRKMLSNLRSENATVNKEIVQRKKNKTIELGELELQETAKNDREIVIKEYDDQLHEFREKMKDLKTVHAAANKAVTLKRKNFEHEKKERGHQVQPPIPPAEIDESQLGCDPY